MSRGIRLKNHTPQISVWLKRLQCCTNDCIRPLRTSVHREDLESKKYIVRIPSGRLVQFVIDNLHQQFDSLLFHHTKRRAIRSVHVLKQTDQRMECGRTADVGARQCDESQYVANSFRVRLGFDRVIFQFAQPDSVIVNRGPSGTSDNSKETSVICSWE